MFNATVLEKGIDCGNLFLIQFNSDISGLPENNFDSIFYAINLPEAFKIEGKKSKLKLEHLRMMNWWLAQHWELDILLYIL